MFKINNNKLFSKDSYLIAIAIILLASVSFFTFSMESETSAFDLFSDEVMVANMLYDNEVENTENPAEKILLQISKNAPYGITNAFKDTNLEGITFINYLSQIGFHGIVYSAIVGVSPLPNDTMLSLFWLTNSLLLAVVLVVIFKQLDKLLSLNYWFILAVFSALFFTDLMQYGNNLYWLGWAIFMPVAVSLCFVNSKHMQGKRLYLKVFFVTLLPALLKLSFYYEFVSSIFISLMLPFLFWAIMQKKQNFKKSVMVLVVGSLGAITAFVLAILIQYWQTTVALGAKASFFEGLMAIIDNRLMGDDTFTVSIPYVILRLLTLEIFNVFNISFLYLHAVLLFALNALFCILHKKIRSDKKAMQLIAFTAISFTAPLSWFILAAPHTFKHPNQCLVVFFLPTLFLVLIQAFETFKCMGFKLAKIR